MESISSRSNPKIKLARALRARKEREATGLFVVEGLAHVGAAVEAGASIESLFYAPELLKSDFGRRLVATARQNGVEPLAVAPEVLESVSAKDNPPGLLAIVRKPAARPQGLAADQQSVFVALVAPQDPGNIGAILRTLDAVNGAGLFLVDGGADAYHPGAVRASMGALFYRPVFEMTWPDFIGWVKASECSLIGTSAKAELDYRAAEYRRPAVLLLGSEQKGLAPEQLAACHRQVSMPMLGKVSSLNLAVAAGVMLYAMLQSPALGHGKPAGRA